MMENSWIAAQKKAFSRWANVHLAHRGLKITDIDNDLRTGTTLISLLEILSGESINSIGHRTNVPMDGKIQKLTNAARALKFIESQGINLVNCRPEHLVDNNTKMVLGLLWRVITKYHIQPNLTEEELVPDSVAHPSVSKSQKMGHFLNKITRDALLRWCRAELESYNIVLANFTKSFQNSVVLAALVHKQRPDLIRLDELSHMDAAAGLSYVFSVAENGLGIPRLLDPSDLLDGAADECSVMTYVAYFLNHKRGDPQDKRKKHADISDTPTEEVTGRPRRSSSAAEPSFAIDDVLAENQRLKKENEALREYMKKQIESIYVSVEHNVEKTTEEFHNKMNAVVRKMLRLELTLTKLTDLAAENAKHIADLELREKEREMEDREREEREREERERERERKRLSGGPLDGASDLKQAFYISSHDLRLAELNLLLPNNEHDLVPTDIITDDDVIINGALTTNHTHPTPTPTPSTPSRAELIRKASMVNLTPAKKIKKDKIVLAQSIARRWLGKRRFRRAKRRRELVHEIITTEKNYISNLHLMTQEYFIPLREMAKDRNHILSHTLNENMLKTIFSNIEVILNINSMLLKKLQQRWEAWNYLQLYGDVFLSMIDFLKCYNQYVNHYNKSLDTLAECAKSPAFLDFIRLKASKCGRELRDLLIIPIQRIPRYVILLEELVKTTEPDHPDYTNLSTAVAKMQSIADYVNEKKRDFEALAQVSAVQDMLVGISILEYPRLRYIMEGDLSMYTDDAKKQAQLHVFLFNEMLVCCKQVKKVFGDRKQKMPKYKFKNMITLTVDTKVGSNNENSFFVEIAGGEETQHFVTKNGDKESWVNSIKKSIDKMKEGKKVKADRASKTM